MSILADLKARCAQAAATAWRNSIAGVCLDDKGVYCVTIDGHRRYEPHWLIDYLNARIVIPLAQGQAA